MSRGLNGRIACVGAAALVLALGFAASAGAGAASLPTGEFTLFSNFGPGDTYNTGIGWTVSEPGSVVHFNRFAMAFTPSVNAQVVQIDVALTNNLGSNNATISLAADDGGIPGTVLRSWPVSGQPPFDDCCPVATVDNSLIPVAAGRQYWVIATAGPNSADDTWDEWMFNSTGQTGPVSRDGGSGFHTVLATEGAFDVIGCGKVCRVA